MIRFLIKGLWRDKSRSRLPIIVVSIGVMLTVFMHAYITGIMGDTIEMNARFNNGHVKVMTQAYAELMNQLPNDLALLEVDALLEELTEAYPEIEWAPRIIFGGLIDVPDSEGETRAQGPAMGMGLDLRSENSKEIERLRLQEVMVRGEVPKNPGDAILSEEFSRKLGIDPGDTITLIGSSMHGSLAVYNFIVSGTLSFGVEILDKGSLIADIADVQQALDMPDAASEILGFFNTGFYDDSQALQMVNTFVPPSGSDDKAFAPVMLSLSQQGSMGQYVQMSNVWSFYISLVFIIAMSLVLWNAGLLGGLRRYGEVGLRLAMGEMKGQVYRTMIYESVVIGLTGSVIGTAIGLVFSWLLQTYGIDISGMMKGASLMMPSEIRARITPPDFYLGFIPGLLSTVLGTMLSGIGIYKRETARLFKELEA